MSATPKMRISAPGRGPHDPGEELARRTRSWSAKRRAWVESLVVWSARVRNAWRIVRCGDFGEASGSVEDGSGLNGWWGVRWTHETGDGGSVGEGSAPSGVERRMYERVVRKHIRSVRQATRSTQWESSNAGAFNIGGTRSTGHSGIDVGLWDGVSGGVHGAGVPFAVATLAFRSRCGGRPGRANFVMLLGRSFSTFRFIIGKLDEPEGWRKCAT
ncbi:hypothetical protein BDK51DRAFT_33272 [Blyttiomyces helicus]|uniref:Uncharacterized protein n=1 Tax=Blyttiomyces helicus TaxID=388810 RepID=A0A4V1IPQ5_9FUNG|nr:hypothetical protein BDK51DRAFT_33272 [Blyttiomyces helicus]|eukprot:RKO83877.1 hypothetical protein BDK51DRAFT_33272 [Blyttiomyces helicus]